MTEAAYSLMFNNLTKLAKKMSMQQVLFQFSRSAGSMKNLSGYKKFWAV